MQKYQLLSALVVVLALAALLPSCNLQEDRIARFKGEYLCISLALLMEKAQKSLHVRGELDTLYGLSWLTGYVIDSENNDIVLVGKRNPQRSAYHFEDLLVNFQNVFNDSTQQAPYCSLDPLPENIRKLQQVLNTHFNDPQSEVDAVKKAVGPQQVVIGGVPRNSRHGNVMIFADYEMKKLSQGLKRMPGISSTLDISLSLTGTQSSSSRFWFHIKKNKPGQVYPSFDFNRGIVFIKECPVVVLTEKQQMDAAGNLSDQTNSSDPVAEAFAEEFSQNFSQLALKNPLFCDLENLFRLQACMRAMKIQNALEESAINTAPFFNLHLDEGGPSELPKALPGLVNAALKEEVKEHANGKTTRTIVQIVAGGVSQEMKIGAKNLIETRAIREPARILLQKRPSQESLFWMVAF